MVKRQARTSRSVWEDQATEYNPEAPAVVSALRGEKWKRRALYTIAWCVIPLCLLITLGFVSSNVTGQKTTDAAAASISTNSSAGKAAAFTAVQAWLASTPSPLPGGTIISWNGYTVENPPPAKSDEAAKPPTYRFETHTFTLARGDQLFTSSIQVVVDGDASAMASTTPNLTPIVNAEIDGQVVAWFGFPDSNAPQAVSDAVKAWAGAFASGDPDELRRAVQDKDPAHTFVPLSGVASIASTDIIAAADVPTGDEDKKPTQMLVRVELSIWWDGEQPAEASQKKPAPMTYDLLIDDANTAAPFVVAWGPAGSGPSLKAHGNALTGVDLKKPAAGQTSGTPSPSPSPTSGGE